MLTYPLVGNYGVPPMTMEEGLPRFFESDKIHVKALVVYDYSFEYSHWNAVKSLGQWLKEHGIPGIYGVDTRQITKIIRERGVMPGRVVTEGGDEPPVFDNPDQMNLVAEVSCKAVETYGGGGMKIVLVDCGCKYNIVRCLRSRDATVVRVPWDYDFTQMDYDGVLLGNGPGDPTLCGATVDGGQYPESDRDRTADIRHLPGAPAAGIGGRRHKLKYGHRSHNQPALSKRERTTR